MSWDTSIKTKPITKPINISYRTCQVEDLDQVLAIETTAYTHPWSKQQFASSLKDNNTSATLLLLDGTIVGYVWCLAGIEQADILNICIDPRHQGKGLGKTLFAHLCNQLRAQGVQQLFLEVRASNYKATQFYQQVGFTQIDTRKKYYSNGESAKIMLFYLKPN